MRRRRKNDTNFITATPQKRKIHQPTKVARKVPNSHPRIVPSTVLSTNRSRVPQLKIKRKFVRPKLNSYPKKIEICIYCVEDL